MKEHIQTHKEEIKKIIDNMDAAKAGGPDKII